MRNCIKRRDAFTVTSTIKSRLMLAKIMSGHPQLDPVGGGDAPDFPCPILMLVYNGWEHVISGLAAMQPAIRNIWLINNGSTIDRTDEVRQAFPEIRIISTGANLGWAGGYNYAIGIAETEGFDAVYLLNSDAILQAGAVNQAVVTLRANSDAAVVGSMILHDRGKRVLFDGDWDWHGPIAVAPLRNELREVRNIHGAGFALSLAAYREIGPFHEEYFLYHEEIDWCFRAQATGWRVLVDCKSRVDHEGEGSSTGASRLYYIARNRFLAMRRGVALRSRKESAMSIIEDEYLAAITLTDIERTAITNGVIDGMLGRFGPRRMAHPTAITAPIMLLLFVIVRAKRKINTILPKL